MTHQHTKAKIISPKKTRNPWNSQNPITCSAVP